MSDPAIVDSGFILALIDKSDQYHARSWTLLNDPRWRFRVPSAVFVEVFHNRLRRGVPRENRQHMSRQFGEALRWLTGPDVPFQYEEPTRSDFQQIAALLDKYADVGVDYVDALVVATAERLKTPYIMTVDQKDFLIYRPSFADRFILPLFEG